VKLRCRDGENLATALPFGVAEILEAAGRPESALDLACGSGRLTLELARRGAAATGVDTSAKALDAARGRAREAGVRVTFAHADMDEPLPFPDGALAVVTSRLALMIARDPPATLREAARIVRPGGTVVTAVWARIEENPWFGEPRAAVAEALGPARAAFARVFGRLGDVDELVDLHREAGFADVRGGVLRDEIAAADAEAHWRDLTGRIGHYTRLDAALTPEERGLVTAVLARRLAPFHANTGLRLPRAMVIVSARR
jgi:ubiquinone/menaquinone biosynthesis C-methylase UbiE